MSLHIASSSAQGLVRAEATPGRGLVLILGVLTAIGPVAIDLYLPAMPEIARELRVDGGTVQLTLSIFMVGMAVGQALYGPIADRWGRRRPLLVGMMIFAGAAAGCACAESMASLLFWRLVMALGGSACMVMPRAVVRDRFAEKDSARVYSVLILILGVSPILAPSLGGQLMEFTNWRGIFWVMAGLGVACVLMVAAGLRESLPRERRLTGGLGPVARTYGRLLSDRHFLGTVLASGFSLGSLFAYMSSSSFVFIELHGLTPQRFALVFGFNAAGMIAASQLNRWLVGRIEVRRVLEAAFLVNTVAGALLLAAVAAGWGGFPVLVALLFASMSAAGVIFPNLTTLAMGPHGTVAGSASALLGVFQFGVAAIIGGLIGVAHNGTALPMVAGMAFCATAAWAVFRWLAGTVRPG